MPNLLIVLTAALAGVTLGWLQRRNLNALAYRAADEAPPPPGRRTWVIPAVAVALATVATVMLDTGDPFGWGLVPLALAGPWLAAVDLDVLRLPNRVLVPTAATTLLISAVAAATSGGWVPFGVGLLCALGCGGVLAALSARGGGFGFGDVKLAAVIGLALGSVEWTLAWAAMLTGSLAGLLWAKLTRRTRNFPFGPWLLVGAWIGAVLVLVPTLN